MRNPERLKPFVTPKGTAELVLHIITRPTEGRYEVCRIVPGAPPISVGAFDSHDEAMAVRNKLDLANDNFGDEALPEDFHDLLCRL